MNYLLFILINIFLIIIFSKIAKKINLVDVPNHRKLHHFNVPLIGGICIYLSLLILVIFFQLSNILFYNHIIYFSFSIVFLGFLDDYKNINYKLRVIFILLISYFIILIEGVYLIDLGVFFNLSIINLGVVGIILTLFSVFALVNAFNFLDGIDGLTSIQAIIILLTLLLYFYHINFFSNQKYVLPIRAYFFQKSAYNLYLQYPFF